MTRDQAMRLSNCLMEAGAHPMEDEGWQMVFLIGNVWVSVACTPFTQGVEMWAKGLWREPKERLSVAGVLHELVQLLESVR